MCTRKRYKARIILAGIFMMSVLAWLTVSLPFVYKAQKVHHAKMAAANEEAGDDNPLANTTEEKTSSSTNFSEEYIHEYHSNEHFLTELPIDYKIEHVATYTAFYGELLSPPPDHI